MKIEKKSCVNAGCSTKTTTDSAKDKDTEKKQVESVEDINDFDAEAGEDSEDIEAKKNLALAKQFYTLAENHVQNAIEALGNAASSGDKYAKQEIADLSVILIDLKNLQRMG